MRLKLLSWLRGVPEEEVRERIESADARARENYVGSLRNRIDELEKENTKLRAELARLADEKIESLEDVALGNAIKTILAQFGDKRDAKETTRDFLLRQENIEWQLRAAQRSKEMAMLYRSFGGAFGSARYPFGDGTPW